MTGPISAVRRHNRGSLVFAAAMLLAFVSTAAAQPGMVTGAVQESTSGEAVEYANVVLYRTSDSTQVTGGITDGTGRFVLAPVPPGSYYVEVSFIGFAPERVREIEVAAGQPTDVGTLELSPSAVAVEGAEAVGEKPVFRYEVDKKIVEVGKMPQVQGGNAADALENAPSVRVDVEGNVSLRGSENFTLLIDGRPSVLEPQDALQQIPASTIERIEIITNPSAKYDPDGTAGIINIILKEQKQLGLSALANATAGWRRRYGGDLLLSYRKGIVNAHAGGDYNHRFWHSERDYLNRTFAQDETLSVTGAGTSDWLPRFGGGRAGVELKFNEHDVASFSGRYGAYRSGNTSELQVEERFLPGDSTRSYTNGGGMGWAGRYVYLLGDFQHSFDTSAHLLLARVTLSNNSTESYQTSVLLGTAGDTTSGRKSTENGPQGRFEGKLEYKLPLREKDEFEAGYQARLEWTDPQYDQYWYQAPGGFVLDPDNSHPYSGGRNIHSAFATYSFNWRKFGAKLGMRGEYGQRVIEVPAERYEVAKWDYFPTVHLTQGLGPVQATVSYSRRIQRPWPWMLRPFRTWTAERSAMQGNPELRPEYADSYEAGFQFPFGMNLVTIEGFRRVSTDAFEFVTGVDPDYPNVLLSTARNVGSDWSTGAEAMVRYSPFKWWNINLTASVYDYRAKGEINGAAYDRSSFNWDGNGTFDFRFPTNTRLTLTGYYSSPSVDAQGSNEGYFVTTAAVQQRLLQRALSITLSVRDPLGTGNWTYKGSGTGFETSGEYRHNWPVVTLSVRYNFNNFRFDPKMREGQQPEGQQGGPGM